MATITRRTFRSTPYRDAMDTWIAITDLLLQGRSTSAAAELHAVAGIAASLIADEALSAAPIVVTCEGPRTRIYAVYNDDALGDADAVEDALAYDPLQGNWAISLPCFADNLDWVQKALGRHSSRITARDVNDEQVAAVDQVSTASSTGPLIVDMKGLLQ
jgi:hypothetical protein